MDQRYALRESLGNFLRTLGDLMVLNWLWIFCCLPVITAGPATCAMFSVTLKLARGEPANIIRNFFRAFWENLKSGLVLGLIALAMLAVVGVDAFFAMQQTGLLRPVYLITATIIAVVFLIFSSYVFALQAMFNSPLKTQIKNAFLLAFTAPGRTIAMWIIYAIPMAAFILLSWDVLQVVGFVYLIAGFSGPIYLNSRILRNVFDKVNGSPVIPDPQVEEK